MTRKRALGLILSVLMAAVLLVGVIPVAKAYTIDGYHTDSVTRWNRYENNGHMGKKGTTYKYASSAIKTKYSSYINAGKAMWGSDISMVESSGNADGSIVVSAMSSSVSASTRVEYYSNMHAARWWLTIVSSVFDSSECSDEGRKRTIAHEIGHVYGLDHVNYSSQIMYPYYSASKNITAYDRAGMSVMTHAHTHNGSYPTRIERDGNLAHKIRCTTCKAYIVKVICPATYYHSDDKHYRVVDCNVCGNHNTTWWYCSGNPCVLPNSIRITHTEK